MTIPLVVGIQRFLESCEASTTSTTVAAGMVTSKFTRRSSLRSAVSSPLFGPTALQARCMRMIRKDLAGLLFTLLVLLVVPVPASLGAVADAALPRLPCGVASYPALPALDAPPNAGLWTGAALGGEWVPPACTGWQAGPTTFVVALAGHFTNAHDVGAMLAHIGMISALPEVRYWSVTDKKWDSLFTKATSLRGPDANTPRGDFSAAEFHSGSELYFLSADNRMQKDSVTRLRAKDVETQHAVLEMTNVAPLRWLAFTVVPAGDMQTLYFLDRQPDGSWQFYSVTRILNASFLLSRLVTGPSYVNRAVAMYRYIAGIPTDRDPPAAP